MGREVPRIGCERVEIEVEVEKKTYDVISNNDLASVLF
jgi:hypothetical protein